MPVLPETVSNDETIIEVSWPAEDRAAGRARRCVRGWLGDPQGLDVGDVELMISELVTNAYQHSGRPDGRVRLVAVCGPDRLRVEVTDVGRGRTVPAPRRPDADGVRGRGLVIVEEFADGWGHRTDPDTGARTVWFEMARRTHVVPDGGARAAFARCDAAR